MKSIVRLAVLILTIHLGGCLKQTFNEKMDVAMKDEDLRFYTVTMNDIPAIFQQLKITGNNGSCAILAFFPQTRDKNNHLEIQYCIEENVIGLDWVFIGEVKDRDKELFISFAKSNAHEILDKKLNGVRYLRVVDGDLVKLMKGILSEVYALKPEHKFELIAGRFKVKGLNYSKHELYSDFYSNQ